MLGKEAPTGDADVLKYPSRQETLEALGWTTGLEFCSTQRTTYAGRNGKR